MIRKTRLALMAAALAAGATAALAITPGSEQARVFASAPVSLTQAIAAAEKQVGGKAAKAAFDHSKQYGWVYKVEVLNGDREFDVRVDAEKGTVVSSEEDVDDKRRRSSRNERRK